MPPAETGLQRDTAYQAKEVRRAGNVIYLFAWYHTKNLKCGGMCFVVCCLLCTTMAAHSHAASATDKE